MSKRRLLSTLNTLIQFRNTCSVRNPAICAKKMEPKVNLTEDPAFQKLQEYYNGNAEKINIPQLFQQNPDRFNKFR